jgi:hypothetical protein
LFYFRVKGKEAIKHLKIQHCVAAYWAHPSWQIFHYDRFSTTNESMYDPALFHLAGTALNNAFHRQLPPRSVGVIHFGGCGSYTVMIATGKPEYDATM